MQLLAIVWPIGAGYVCGRIWHAIRRYIF